MVRSNRIRERGTVAHRQEAASLLERPGDSVLVFRGVARALVMSCPDGCGDVLTINLDARTAKAWRYYKKHNQISLFPSVWRDTGCGSHFIVWSHKIIWCDFKDSNEEPVIEEASLLRSRVLQKMLYTWVHYSEIAQSLDAVPWDVQSICSDLAHKESLAEEGAGKMRGFFRKRPA